MKIKSICIWIKQQKEIAVLTSDLCRKSTEGHQKRSWWGTPPTFPSRAVFEHSKPDEKVPRWWCWGKCCFRTSLIPCSPLSSCQMPCCQVWRGQGVLKPPQRLSRMAGYEHTSHGLVWFVTLLFVSRGAVWLIGWMNVDELNFDNICTGNNTLSYSSIKVNV